MLIARRPEHGQPIVRAAWCFIEFFFEAFRLIHVSHDDFSRIRGSVIVANHPSLIDVLLLTVFIPRTIYVAKHKLKSNPFLAAIVVSTALDDNAELPATAAKLLKAGWNVVIFPEGTRTPANSQLGPLRRGAAHIALEARAPIEVMRIDFAHRVLGKGQPITDVGKETISVSIRSLARLSPDEMTDRSRAAAITLTKKIAELLSR